MGLNHTGPLIHRYFSIVKFYDPQLVESIDAEGFMDMEGQLNLHNILKYDGNKWKRKSMSAGCAEFVLQHSPEKGQGTEFLSVRQKVLRVGKVLMDPPYSELVGHK